MTRQEVLDWLSQHPDTADADPEEALEEVELEVKRHAEELAWLEAKRMAEAQRSYWSHRSHAMHCPEHWAVKEFCLELARDMKHHEPKPAEGSEAEFASELYLHPFREEARQRLLEWVHDLAAHEEHRVWREVIRFTRGRPKRWVHDGVFSTEQRWEYTHSYSEAAERAAGLLVRDFDSRAHAH